MFRFSRTGGALLIAIASTATLALASPFPATASSVEPNSVAADDVNAIAWQDVPSGQTVRITDAVFDLGGYRLYTAAGETIVLPFTNDNLYVLRFARSYDGYTYFTNNGGIPTLYLPEGGYLINAAADGAYWYPFPSGYNYEGPIYLGIAPSWSDFVGMDWYPGMIYYGGFGGYHPWTGYSTAFTALPGLSFTVYGHPYRGWNRYSWYRRQHPHYGIRIRHVYNDTAVLNRYHHGAAYLHPHNSIAQSPGHYGPPGTYGRTSEGVYLPRGISGSGNRGQVPRPNYSQPVVPHYSVRQPGVAYPIERNRPWTLRQNPTRVPTVRPYSGGVPVIRPGVGKVPVAPVPMGRPRVVPVRPFTGGGPVYRQPIPQPNVGRMPTAPMVRPNVTAPAPVVRPAVPMPRLQGGGGGVHR